MLTIQENVDLRSKTTLRIGGTARYYAELNSKQDCEDAVRFAEEKSIPLILLGGGSNTIFADGTIKAFIIRIKAEKVECHAEHGRSMARVKVQAGKHLANLVNECAEQNLDLSPLTGIPGTIGGAIFGNAGQGFGGIWMDRFVESVEVFEWIEDREKWKVYSKDECCFGYRTSKFKKQLSTIHYPLSSPLIWSCTLNIPSKPSTEIQAEVDQLLQKRIDTQPHVKTAGSIFLSKDKDQPAWKLIDAKGLRGAKIGGIEVSEKHANFLINDGNATFDDVKKMITNIQKETDEDLHVEMRCIEEDGNLAF